MELATMYYDFINDYSNMFNVKTFIEKEKIRSDGKTNAVIEILNEYYINGTMFCFLKSDKEKAINDIVKKLQSKNGTSDLINKLEVVIDDDENYLVQIILMYDNCNNNIETLKNKVDKRYKNNQKFHKKDYFDLFLKYNDLFNKLNYHYDNNV